MISRFRKFLLLQSGVPPVAPPVVTSVTPSLGDSGGGITVVIAGTGFTTATAVDLEGTPFTSFVINSDIQITAVTPAKAAGVWDVSVTNPGGTGTLANAYESFDIAAQPFTVLLYKGNYAVPTWPGRASAGPSLGADYSQIDPLYTPLDNNSAPETPGQRTLDNALTDRVTDAGSTIIAIIQPEETVPSSGPGLRIDDPGIVSMDTGAVVWGMTISDDGICPIVFDGAYQELGPLGAAPPVIGTPVFISMKWDSADLKGALNGGAMTSIPAAVVTGATTAGTVIARNYAGSYQNGIYNLVAIAASVLSDAVIAKIYAWASSLGLMTAVEPLPLFDVTFANVLSLGPTAAAAFTTATGLTLVRPSVSTVQTGPDSLDATPAIDDACLGLISGRTGLVLQPNTLNWLGLGTPGNAMPRDLSVAAGWTGGTATLTAAFALGPDGVNNADELAAASGQFGSYTTRNLTPGCYSSWQQSGGGSGDKQSVRASVVNTPGLVNVGTGTAAWERLILGAAATPGNVQMVLDCRNWVGVPPGTAPSARTVLVDYVQLEDTEYATEAIATGDTHRDADLLSHPDASLLITSDGRIRSFLTFYPKYSTTMAVRYNGSTGNGVTAACYLWSWDANNYAYIDETTKNVVVSINGVPTTSTNPIAFTAFDKVDLYISVGSASVSVCKYRINNGAWVDLVLANVVDVPASGAVPMSLFHNAAGVATADSGVLPCLAGRIAFYSTRQSHP